jgi:hypothetical protein
MQVLDVPAIEGTAITVDGENIGKGLQGKVVYFLTEDGPYKGLPNGVLIQLQDGLFSIEDLDRGTAILKTDNGYQQYVTICPLRAGLGGASGSMEMPKTEAIGSET